VQGQGSQECFLGIHTPLEKAQVALLPIAFGMTTTYGSGTEKGPAALIDASRNLELYDVETRREASDEGIFTAPILSPKSCDAMIKEVEQAAITYLEAGKFLVAVGGEHSISFPLVKAHAERYGPISVLQLDAHTDLVDAYEGNPHSHASVMARVRTLSSVESTVAVGIRSMAKEEAALMQKEKIFFAHELTDDLKWMDQVVDELSDRVYITFDLDVFDSALMPATGTPEPGGISWNTAMILLKKVIQKRSVVGFDVVELCPIPGMHAPDYLAAKLVYKCMNYLFYQEELSHANGRFHGKTL